MENIDQLRNRFKASGFAHPADYLAAEMDIKSLRLLRSSIPIRDSSESLMPIPDGIGRILPHPYQAVGAPYGKWSPWFLRLSVIDRLQKAQLYLTTELPGAILMAFDGYRPRAVQSFMVEWECERLAVQSGCSSFANAGCSRQKIIRDEVLKFWAEPSSDMSAPSPHSTGAAIDLSIADSSGNQLEMGTDIDELADASLPNFFEEATTERERMYHSNRELLRRVMEGAGFRRLPTEWWHFSFGDQAWALIRSLEESSKVVAHYGSVEQTA